MQVISLSGAHFLATILKLWLKTKADPIITSKILIHLTENLLWTELYDITFMEAKDRQ